MLPDSDIADQIISLSQQLQDKGTYFTLKPGEYYPHASLYMVQLDMDKIDEISARLSQIAENTPQITLTAKEYHQEFGYIDVEYSREDAVDNLQMEVVNAINPIRDGLRQKDKDRLESAVGKERENIEKYGYRSVGELFAPHITITRFTDSEPIDTTSLPNLDGFIATFTKIGVFEMGENGTCVRKIAEFDLGTA